MSTRYTADSGLTTYVVFDNGATPPLYWNALTAAYEAYNAANWTSAKYCVAGTEIGATGTYYVATPAGAVNAIAYQRIGGSPAVTDTKLASGDVTLAAIKAKTDLIPASPAAVGDVTTVGTAVAAVNTKLGTPAGASVSVDIAAVKTDTGNLVTRITATLFSGITSLLQILGLIAGKQVGNSTARTELRATGAGSGTFDETTDSLEAVRDKANEIDTAVDGIDLEFDGLAAEVVTAIRNAGAQTAYPAQQYGDRVIIQGDSYSATARQFLITKETAAEWPTDLSDGWTWAFTATKRTDNVNAGTSPITGTVGVVTATGDSRALRVSLTATVTGAAALGEYEYDVQGTKASEKFTVETGQLTVKQDHTT